MLVAQGVVQTIGIDLWIEDSPPQGVVQIIGIDLWIEDLPHNQGVYCATVSSIPNMDPYRYSFHICPKITKSSQYC